MLTECPSVKALRCVGQIPLFFACEITGALRILSSHGPVQCLWRHWKFNWHRITLSRDHWIACSLPVSRKF